MTPSSSSPVIGIRDSGAGGLTVARQVRRLLPGIPLLYFADTANVPYGDRDPAEIQHFACSITNFLQHHGANLVIFACNTTSAYALEPARKHFTIPLLGMIEGGVDAMLAALDTSITNPTIGVLATSATVRSGVYTRQILARCSQAHCLEIACPRFVPLVEADEINSAAALEACAEAMAPLLDANVDAVILGCTHFPLLLPTLQQIAPNTLFIDPAVGVAQQAAQLIEHTFDQPKSTFTSPQDTYFASGPTDMLQHWIAQLMCPAAAPQICRGPIFRLK